MRKKEILDHLGSRDYLASVKSGEIDFVNALFERVKDHDYEGMAEAARRQGLDLEPILAALEEIALQNLKEPRPLSLYEFHSLEKLLAPRDAKSADGSAQSTVKEIDPDRLRELYFSLIGKRFGEKQIDKIRYFLTVWSLKELALFVWEKGLSIYFNNRYRQLSGEKSEKLLPIEEIVQKVEVAEILEQNKLIQDYVFDETGSSGSSEGLKEGLLKEKTSREKAVELVEELFALFARQSLDLSRIKQKMDELHMGHRIDMLERLGINYLRQYVKDNFIEGARETANRFGFTFPEGIDGLDPEQAAGRINDSFLSQATAGDKGRSFLCWEAMFSRDLTIFAAHCYELGSGYLLLSISPIEEVDHYLFGYYPTVHDKHNFLTRFLSLYFKLGKLGKTAAELIQHYLDANAGQIKLKNAFKVAAFAFPVVITVAILVGWVYHLTIGELGEGTLLAACLVLIGETIAARNGYSQTIKPDDHEMIPEYAIREQGILRIKPL
ncbi:MAG: hypothetical protein V1794_18395, partial [Candidatus Glassbacteria bacterium]